MRLIAFIIVPVVLFIMIMSTGNAHALKLKDRRFNTLREQTYNAYYICTRTSLHLEKKQDVASQKSVELSQHFTSAIHQAAMKNNIDLRLHMLDYSVDNTHPPLASIVFEAQYQMSNRQQADNLAKLLQRQGFKTMIRTSKQRKISCD